MSDARISPYKCDFRKVVRYLKEVSPFDKNNCSIGSIDINVTDNEVVKMKEKDAFKYSLKCSEKVRTLPTKISVKLSRKCEATFVSDRSHSGEELQY